MIFLYILEYLLVGFLYNRLIEKYNPDKLPRGLIVINIFLWPLPVISFIIGFIRGLYINIKQRL